jgi:flagellar hook-associated protein 1 FlgK
MSLSGALNTIQAGLQVTQSALQIVGSNVANAQTPGYVRKAQDQISTAAGNSISVRAGSIQRQLDQLIQSQLRQATSGGGYADKLRLGPSDAVRRGLGDRDRLAVQRLHSNVQTRG